jgi:phytoene synthase
MINSEARVAEHALAIGYALPDTRPALDALWSLDATFAAIVRAARDPLVGEMRLTWWYEALEALDHAPPPAQPVLAALTRELLSRDVAGAALAMMIDGWSALIEPGPLDAERMAIHANARGEGLFVAAARALGAGGDPAATAGRGWALADLAIHLSDPGERAAAQAAARPLLADATASRWSRAGRPLGALAHLARMDLLPDPRPPGSPARVARLLRHRLTGG